MAETVLVTGGSGFLAGHAIARLLDDGYRVRATLRSLSRESEVRATLKVSDDAPLEFVTADLTEDDGWPAALIGCDYVMHMASPFPQDRPDDENELIAPAVEGTRRVLRAAHEAGVRRVVMTSSFAAMEYAPKASGAQYVETDWTDPDGRAPYVKSKTLAERAAWDFVAAHPDGPELSVINPVGIIGPVLSNDYASSISIIKALLGRQPAGVAEAELSVGGCARRRRPPYARADASRRGRAAIPRRRGNTAADGADGGHPAPQVRRRRGPGADPAGARLGTTRGRHGVAAAA